MTTKNPLTEEEKLLLNWPEDYEELSRREKKTWANKVYRLRNKEKRAESTRKYYEKNKEKIAEYRGREDVQQRMKISRRKHYEKNKEKLDSYSKEYAKRNLAWKAAHCAKRRAAKLKATPPWVNLKDIEDVYKEAQYFGLVVDHIVPLQNKRVCGLHTWDNLQLLTREENCKKNNRFEI